MGISKEEGLEIVKDKITLMYDSKQNIKGKNYYVYTVNNEQFTYANHAYFVDVDSSELFKCNREDMSLTPIK